MAFALSPRSACNMAPTSNTNRRYDGSHQIRRRSKASFARKTMRSFRGKGPLHHRWTIRHRPRCTHWCCAQPACACEIHRQYHPRARGLPGVGAILTAEGRERTSAAYPACSTWKWIRSRVLLTRSLAHDVVRHVGDAIAFVVARQHRSGPRDAIEGHRGQLDAVAGPWVGVAKRGQETARPQVWPSHPGNVLFDVPVGDKKATEAAFCQKRMPVAEVSHRQSPASSPTSWKTRAGSRRIRRQARTI